MGAAAAKKKDNSAIFLSGTPPASPSFKRRSPRKKGEKNSTDSPPASPSVSSAKPIVVIDPDKVLFGVPLEVSVVRSDIELGAVPFPIRHTIEYLDRKSLNVEGIYRIPGAHSKIQNFIQSFNLGSTNVYGETEDTHAVAGVLKAFLRELPEPLLTNELKPEFKKAADIMDAETRNQKIRTLLGSLPAVNRETVKFIYGHLARVAAAAGQNKMTASNLTFSLCPDVGQVSTYMIEGYENLFSNLKVQRVKSTPQLQPPPKLGIANSELTRSSLSTSAANIYIMESPPKIGRSGSFGGSQINRRTDFDPKDPADAPKPKTKTKLVETELIITPDDTE